MSEMVERVARKLEPQAWAALGTGDTLAYENRRKSSLRKARRAIEAMRKPNQSMIDAGSVYAEYSVEAAWMEMIDAALKD